MYEPYMLSFDTAKPYDPPGVPTYCLHGILLFLIAKQNKTKQ